MNYNPTIEVYFKVDLNGPEMIKYPIQDDIWPSRRWNREKTESIDLSGHNIICQSCYSKRVKADDVNIDGHIICSKKGCAHDALPFHKYCFECYDESYPPNKF